MQQKPSDQQRAAVAAKLHDSIKYTFAKIGDATGFDFTVGKPKQVGAGFEYTFQVHAFVNMARMEEAAKRAGLVPRTLARLEREREAAKCE